jgi:hypothetical protein
MHGPVFHPVTQGDLLIVSANNTEHFMLLTEQESKAFAHVPAHTCQHRTGDERPREQRLQSAPNREFLCVCGLCVLYQLHPPTACPRLLSHIPTVQTIPLQVLLQEALLKCKYGERMGSWAKS